MNGVEVIRTFDEINADILDGMQQSALNYMRVGAGLMEMRETKAYRQHFGTFEEYGTQALGMSKQHMYRLMNAYKYVIEKSPAGDLLPEFSIRALLSSKAKDPDAPEVAGKPVPVRRPKRETTSEHDQVIEMIRLQLTDLREQYAIVTYWQPVWDAIDELNKGSKK